MLWGTCDYALVVGAVSPLSAGQRNLQYCVLVLCVFGMVLGSPVFNTHCCVPVFLENQCGSSCIEFVGSCVYLGFGNFWVCTCLLMILSQEFDDDPQFWN